MKINKCTEKPMAYMDCTFSKEEIRSLVAFADANMTDKEIEDLKIEWSMVRILSQAVDSEEIKEKIAKVKEKDKKSKKPKAMKPRKSN